MDIEYDKWMYVKGCETEADARAFFGVAPNTPAKLDPERTLRNGQKTWKVLSPAWVEQQTKR